MRGAVLGALASLEPRRWRVVRLSILGVHPTRYGIRVFHALMSIGVANVGGPIIRYTLLV